MEKKIQEFVESFIPKSIEDDIKQDLTNELTSHIYDKIDFYIESGFSQKESIEKALVSFAEKNETKDKLKEEFNEIHRKKSLADFLVLALPFLIITSFLFYTLIFKNTITLSSIVLYCIIPFVYLIIFKRIAKSEKVKAFTKSLLSVVIVISMISVIISGYFITSDLKVTTYENEEAIEFAEDMFCTNADQPITKPASCRLYYSEIVQFLDYEESRSLILKYSEDGYKKEAERIKNSFVPKKQFYDDFSEKTYATTQFNAYGFIFYCVYDFSTDTEKKDLDAYYHKSWCFVGLNEKTKEIAYIEYDPYEFTPTFDSKFLKNKCGWKYFYPKHFIYS